MGRYIRVQIDSDDMIQMLIDRLDVWADKMDSDAYECYAQYLENCVEDGVFDDMKDFDPKVIVDNLYVNDTSCITKDEFSQWDIEDEDDERILEHVGDYYLIDAVG